MTPPRTGLGPGDDAACLDYGDAHDAGCECPSCRPCCYGEQPCRGHDWHASDWPDCDQPGPEVAWWV